MKRTIALCCLATALSAVGDTFQTYDQFSITLPPGWFWMPENALNQFAQSIDALSPETPGQVYDYGFQYGNTDKWFTYPYILIQVRPVGRIPTGEMARYSKVKRGMEESLDQVREGLASVLAEASAGDPVFDDENRILWTSMSMELQSGVLVRSLIAVKLTETGLIQLSGYATADTYDEYEPIFREAFATIELDEAIRYVPQITDHAPVIGNINLGKVFILCLQAALAGGVLWILYALIRRSVRHALKRD